MYILDNYAEAYTGQEMEALFCFCFSSYCPSGGHIDEFNLTLLKQIRLAKIVVTQVC